jgi:hypothetical protein
MYTKGFFEAEERMFKKFNNIFMAHCVVPGAQELYEKRKVLNEDNRKWAWIKIANTRKLCWVDNKTMQAYKADGYSPTWIEIKKFTFERWATGFDL